MTEVSTSSCLRESKTDLGVLLLAAVGLFLHFQGRGKPTGSSSLSVWLCSSSLLLEMRHLSWVKLTWGLTVPWTSWLISHTMTMYGQLTRMRMFLLHRSPAHLEIWNLVCRLAERVVLSLWFIVVGCIVFYMTCSTAAPWHELINIKAPLLVSLNVWCI